MHVNFGHLSPRMWRTPRREERDEYAHNGKSEGVLWSGLNILNLEDLCHLLELFFKDGLDICVEGVNFLFQVGHLSLQVFLVLRAGSRHGGGLGSG
jgi:hypothetical protein